jgi:hypothetical protein
MDNFDLKKYLSNNKLLNESNQDLINKEIERLGLSPENVEVIMKEGEEQLDEGIKDKIRDLKTAMAKTLLVCSIVGGAASCQKANPHVYKFSYSIEKTSEEAPQEYNGVILTPYSPQEQVGSFYELEDHKLSPSEIEAEEEELAAIEKAKASGKDYIITDYKLEYMGQSKKGDIATTNNTIPSN